MKATLQKLTLLSSLYLAQGLPFGFFTQALPVFMRKQGHSLPAISLSGLLALPWALKFLWAPLVDRYGSQSFGRRRSWIIPLQLSSVVTTMALAFVDPAQGIPVMMAAVFITNLIAATQDIATDGLAVDILHEKERGMGNGIQVAGYRVGMILGGGVLLILFDRLGWKGTFSSMAALLALSSIPVVLHKEAQRPAPAPGHGGLHTGLWTSMLRRPKIFLWLSILVVYKLGDYLASAMVKPMMVDHGFTTAEIGELVGTFGFIAGLCGALGGGYAASRFGRKQALIGCGFLQMLTIAGYILPAAGIVGKQGLAIASIAEHFTGGLATVSLFTLMMDASDPETGATDYTLQASIVVVATGAASSASGFLAEAVGYTAHFAASTAVAAAGLLFSAYALSKGGLPPPYAQSIKTTASTDPAPSPER